MLRMNINMPCTDVAIVKHGNGLCPESALRPVRLSVWLVGHNILHLLTVVFLNEECTHCKTNFANISLGNCLESLMICSVTLDKRQNTVTVLKILTTE